MKKFLAVALLFLFSASSDVSAQQVWTRPTQWTYPGEIRQHLESGHGVDASGMTQEQAEALHDELHNEASGRAVASPQTYLYQQRQTQNYTYQPQRRVFLPRLGGFFRR